MMTDKVRWRDAKALREEIAALKAEVERLTKKVREYALTDMARNDADLIDTKGAPEGI